MVTPKASDADAHIVATIADNADDVLRYFQRRADHQDAADLLAETMLIVWRRSRDVPRDPMHARMWMFGIARNVLHNDERSKRRRWRLADRLRLMSAPEGARAADDGVEVRDAVDRLPGKLAEVVRLVHWEGFSLTQVAEILGEPATTIRSRYLRAKTELHGALTPSNVTAGVRPGQRVGGVDTPADRRSGTDRV